MRVLLLPHSRLLLTVVLSTLALAPGAGAQSVLGRAESMASNAEAYYYVRPGTASVRVQVLGAVRSPGLYEVSEGTGLGPLLALAGGPTLGTMPADTRTVVTIRLHRPRGGSTERVYEGSFEPTAGVVLPTLQDGDVVVTEARSRRTISWRDAIQVISAVGVVALAIDRLSGTGN